MRYVSKSSPPKAARQNLCRGKPDDFKSAYDTIVGNPGRLTPEMAAGLSELLTAYQASQKQ